MIIGGSGITFALPVIQDLVQKGLRGESRVKVIKLVWMVQNPGLHAFPSPTSYPLRFEKYCRCRDTSITCPRVTGEFVPPLDHLCPLP